MPGASKWSGRRGGGRRGVPLAAPAAAGVAAAAASILATSLDVWDLPTQVKIGATITAGLLVGLLTWATTRPAGRGAGQPDGEPGASWRPPDQWPPPSAHFTGRKESLAELRGVFTERFSGRGRTPRDDATASLVVSVYGRAGVGKSALTAMFGHHVGDWFPDGRLYADLRGVDAPIAPEEVLTGFLRALGVRLTTDPGGLDELRKLWLTWTRGRRILIGLDNAHDGDQVRHLLPAEPGCAVIVTSRQPLFLLNTYDKRLEVFSQAMGVELLARLAGDQRVDADPPAAQKIVGLCERLPLAISICGGRLATRENWSLAELAERLDDERRRLDQLELAPNKGVRASLRLSYADCTDIQKRLLRLLSQVAAPDVPGWVAGELLGISPLEGADQLEALMDAQLAECSGKDAAGVLRYRLHELVRLFAHDIALAEEQEEHRRAAIERVLSGYRHRAQNAAMARWPQDWSRAGKHADGQSAVRVQASAADWLNAERLSLVAVIGQARNLALWEPAWALGRAFCSLCHSLRAYWTDWRAVADVLCEAAEHMNDPRSLGIALLERSAVTGGLGLRREALADAERALEIFTGLGETWWAARAMRAVGMTLSSEGNMDRGQEYLTEAIDAFLAEDDRWWSARSQRNLAELRLRQPRLDQAAELLEQALDVFQADGNRYSEAQTLRVYGEVLAAQARTRRDGGDPAGAEGAFTKAGLSLHRAAEMFRARGELWEEARCLRAAGEVGNPGREHGLRELEHVRRAAEMLGSLGDSWGVARTLVSAGRAHARLGRFAEAEETLRGAQRAFDELGDRWWAAQSLYYLGRVRIDAKRPGAADEPLREAYDIFESLGDRAAMGRVREHLNRVPGGNPPDSR
ncbi:tetratricopeptide repeat protein [Spongiactinospora sp. TRM90649]|uniref:ATP-binding protein n=1 Tax=Spongiactinospora sp. TRM90649 TaxID=3031114 RepID=UPI0023F6756F|nr:tetratricopeptide repeat protein [Spongiactinospora sp. TRM90649]MDF5758127.1 tetratricopeptide repeat protein [Spongiactinospora sp. TRM90649]